MKYIFDIYPETGKLFNYLLLDAGHSHMKLDYFRLFFRENNHY